MPLLFSRASSASRAARPRARAAVLALGLFMLALGGCGGSQPTASAPEAGASAGDGEPVVVARYADRVITLSEFERRYARTVGSRAAAADSSAEAYRAFLRDYLDFRLKVHAATEAGMDDDPAIEREVDSYRAQVARPTLLDDAVVMPVVRQLYARKKTEVDASHLLIRVTPDAAPADTAAAYARAAALLDSLAAGAEFGRLAQAYSEDPSAQKYGQLGFRGHLGFLTAGQTVKAFEDAMYATPVDSVAGPVRSPFGYHLVQVHARRPVQPPIEVAHLMVRPDSATAADSLAARRRIDSLATALAQGADFGDLARRFSDDARSAPRGGTLGTVRRSQQIDAAFLDAAFALDEVGDVSGVVETRFGYHLIQLQGRETPKTLAEATPELKQLAGRLPRTDSLRLALARRTRARAGVRVDTTALLSVRDGLGLDSLARALIVPGRLRETATRRVATLGDSTLTLRQLARFVTDTPGAARRPLGAVLTDFLDEKALDYAAASLEARDPDFRAVVTEYREGLLLFSFMQDSVWNVAAQDTAALRALYEADRAAGHPRYRFPERVRLARLSAASAAPLDSLAEALRSGALAPDGLVARARARDDVRVDTATVTKDVEGEDADVWSLRDGEAVGPTEGRTRQTLLVRLGTLPARPRTFDEAASALARDHQDAYEAAVVERLRARYDAERYPARVADAFAEDAAPASADGPTADATR